MQNGVVVWAKQTGIAVSTCSGRAWWIREMELKTSGVFSKSAIFVTSSKTTGSCSPTDRRLQCSGTVM